MSESIRAAAERLLEVVKLPSGTPCAGLLLEQAEDELRAALAAPPPAGGAARGDRLPPKVGHVFRLAGIICDAMAQVSGQTIDPITLAQRILNHPHSQWAPAQEDQGHD